jgi:hypothetical protein
MKYFLPLMLLASLATGFSRKAEAFPELIRHGYVNCNTCHVSPSGGGALIDYGRTFSGEGLSTWTSKNEESIFHGLIKRDQIPGWLSLGGEYRGVQTYRENTAVKEFKWYRMQADLEAAVKVMNFTFDASMGYVILNQNEDMRFASRRIYAMYNFTDEIALRVGKFVPVYGVNLPDHPIATRDPLLMGQGTERLNVEGSWLTDTWNLIATASKGPVEFPTGSQESSIEVQGAYAFHDTYKVGLNAWSGESDAAQRQMAGGFLNFGFNDAFYLLSEVDTMWSTAKTTKASTTGFFNFNRLGYEVVRGLSLLAQYEYWQTDLNNAPSANDRYGAGAEWFPRPHFDFQLLMNQQRSHRTDTYESYDWLMLHYYF